MNRGPGLGSGVAWIQFCLVLSLCGHVAPAAHSFLSCSFLICQFYYWEDYKQHIRLVYIRPQNLFGAAFVTIVIITLTV